MQSVGLCEFMSVYLSARISQQPLTLPRYTVYCRRSSRPLAELGPVFPQQINLPLI